MSNKILILAGGGIKHLDPFLTAGKAIGIGVITSSFSRLSYETSGRETIVKINGIDLKEFAAIYLRLVGKRYEDVALLVSYCRKNNIRLVDKIYGSNGIIRIPIPKSVEVKILHDAGIPVPKTYFGRLSMMRDVCPDLLGFPFVIKGTMGKQGHAVWSPQSMKDLDDLIAEFTPKEKIGERFIAQEFINASQRDRIFVIGERAVAGITRPTRWRKRFLPKVNGRFPEGVREALDPIPEDDIKLAVTASKALGIEVGGVDVITEDTTGKKYVLEVNSAPRWDSIKKDTGINIEQEILKYITAL